MPDKRLPWHNNFEDRELMEIEFAKLYANRFDHGTDGHIWLKTIAKLSAQLDIYKSELDKLKSEE